MYETRTIRDVMFYSIQFKKLMRELGQIQLVKQLGLSVLSGYDNPIFIQLAIREINLQKQLFVYSIELGGETIVPKCLDQKNLPQSYKFYNPVLSIIEELCQDHKRNLYVERNKQMMQQVNMVNDVMTNVFRFMKPQSYREKDADIVAELFNHKEMPI